MEARARETTGLELPFEFRAQVSFRNTGAGDSAHVYGLAASDSSELRDDLVDRLCRIEFVRAGGSEQRLDLANLAKDERSYPLGGVKVQIFAGHSRRLALNRARATVRTQADGSYHVTLRLGRGAWYARAKAATPYQVLASSTGACNSAPGTSLAAKGCVGATLAPFIVVSAPIARVL